MSEFPKREAKAVIPIRYLQQDGGTRVVSIVIVSWKLAKTMTAEAYERASAFADIALIGRATDL